MATSIEDVARIVLPDSDEGYFVGLCILSIIVPIIVGMYYNIDSIYDVIKNNPDYDIGNFRNFVKNARILTIGALVSVLFCMLYTLRKGPSRGDKMNIGFWFSWSTIFLFCLLGARLSLTISFLIVTYSDFIIKFKPSEIIYLKTKMKYLTSAILVTFFASFIGWVLINGVQILDWGHNVVNQIIASGQELA